MKSMVKNTKHLAGITGKLSFEWSLSWEVESMRNWSARRKAKQKSLRLSGCGDNDIRDSDGENYEKV